MRRRSGRPVTVVWRKRRWVCPEPACPAGSFVEQDERIAAPRAMLTVRACRWAIEQIRREHASSTGSAGSWAPAWRTVWDSIRPLLEAGRRGRVPLRGRDHPGRRRARVAPRVDQADQAAGPEGADRDGRPDPHPTEEPRQDGREGPAAGPGPRPLRAGVRPGCATAARRSGPGSQVATLDPFHGYKNAIDDQLEDAVAVLDAFHVVKLATHVVDEVRRRVQQEIHGHRGRKNDPLYRIRNILRAGAEHLTDRQQARLAAAFAADERHVEVEVACQCAQQVRSAYHQDSHAAGRAVAEKILDSLRLVPDPRDRPPRPDPDPVARGVPRPTSPPAARTTAAPKPSTA